MLAPSVGWPQSAAHVARSSACSEVHSYGYIARIHGISCRAASRIAAKANRKGMGPGGGADCAASRVWHMGVWTITGPIEGGLSYRYSRANGQRFVTTKPTDCI